MAVISIQYKEPDVNSYQGVSVYNTFKQERFNFDSGDFVKDWYLALKFVITGGLGEISHLAHSSSVNHFIMDGGSELYDSAYLVMKNEVGNLVYDYTPEGIEFFVKSGSRPTWEEFKKINE
jgi:hypothetical protein